MFSKKFVKSDCCFEVPEFIGHNRANLKNNLTRHCCQLMRATFPPDVYPHWIRTPHGIWNACPSFFRLLHKFRNKDIGAGKFDNVPTATNFLLMQTLCGCLGCNVLFLEGVVPRNVDRDAFQKNLVISDISGI